MKNSLPIKFYSANFSFSISRLVPICIVLLFVTPAVKGQNPFITIWKTNNSGSSSSTQITIPAIGDYTYSWELVDDSAISGSGQGSGQHTITFPDSGTYKVSISPAGSNPFHQIKFDFGGDRKKILSIEQWGDIQWSSMGSAYTETSNLKINATDAPDLQDVTDMSFAFFESGIDNNGSLASWDVSNVVNMEAVFFGTRYFNQPLESWNTENVQILRGMFAGTKIFNQPIATWNVSNVTDMSFMFQDAQAFNQSLEGWDVSAVKNMSYMFSNSLVFNGSVESWNVAQVTNMEGMFTLAYGFNQPLNAWDVSSVTNFATMFSGAILFNHPLDSWDVDQATSLWGMFTGSGFNQNLGNWNLASASNITGMLDRTAMDCENYSLTLLGWKENPQLPSNLILGADEREYSPDAEEARNFLIDTLGWTIEGDTPGTCSLGLNENKPALVQVFPNPSSGIISIQGSSNIERITVYDTSGKLLRSETFHSEENIQIDLTALSKGVYILNIHGKTTVTTSKIILQ